MHKLHVAVLGSTESTACPLWPKDWLLAGQTELNIGTVQLTCTNPKQPLEGLKGL